MAGSSVVTRHCSAVPLTRDRLLVQPQLGQRGAGRDAQLGDDQVPLGDLLGDRVLDLDPRVHLDEDVLPPLVEQELHGARVDVADVRGEGHRVGADPAAQRRVQVGGRGDLDDLLVPALHRAVPLVEVHHVARRVGQDLHLDVPRVDHGLLQEHGGVAERRLGLAHRGLDRLAQLPRLGHPAHAPPAAAGHRLDEHREPDLLGRGDQRVDVGRWLRRVEHGHPGLPGRGHRAGLVAGQVQHLGRRADEGDAGPRAAGGQLRVLGQEAVAGVDGVRTGPPGRLQNLVDGQVGPHRVAGLADLVGLVGLGPVQRVAVLVREHGDRGDAQLVGGAEGPDRDLPPVRDEYLAEHSGAPLLVERRGGRR